MQTDSTISLETVKNKNFIIGDVVNFSSGFSYPLFACCSLHGTGNIGLKSALWCTMSHRCVQIGYGKAGNLFCTSLSFYVLSVKTLFLIFLFLSIALRGFLCDLTLRWSSHLFSAVTYARKQKRPYGDLYKMTIINEFSNTL